VHISFVLLIRSQALLLLGHHIVDPFKLLGSQSQDRRQVPIALGRNSHFETLHEQANNA